jgi:hypothetical protein
MDVAAVATIFAAIVTLGASTQDLIFRYLDQRTKKRRELADTLAPHLKQIAKLYRKSATAIDNKDQVLASTVCNKLRREVRLLEENVLSKILGKSETKKYLANASFAVKVEHAARELIGQPSKIINPYLRILNETADIFRGLSNEAKRRGTG